MLMLPLRAAAVTVPRENFIIGGQSNGVGYGIDPPPLFPLRHRVKNFNNAWQWVDAVEPIDDPTGQIDLVSKDENAKTSFGTSFGSALATLRSAREIGLVPCAAGGTSIEDWGRDLSRSSLYGSMIARAKYAARYGTLKGLLWYQGEKNTVSLAASSGYGTKLDTLIADVKSDLEIPDLAVCVTILGPDPEDPERPYWGSVQSQIAARDGTFENTVAAVDASDLATEADGIHLNTASLVTLGDRYAAAMDALIEGTYGS